MPPSDTYSTTAVDGSADRSSASPSSPTSPSPSRDTSAQRSANAALSTQRITAFLADTSLSPPGISYPGYLKPRSTASARCGAAGEVIASFDTAFAGGEKKHDGNDNNNDDNNKQQPEK